LQAAQIDCLGAFQGLYPKALAALAFEVQPV
jgi:hypothetical protein